MFSQPEVGRYRRVLLKQAAGPYRPHIALLPLFEPLMSLFQGFPWIQGVEGSWGQGSLGVGGTCLGSPVLRVFSGEAFKSWGYVLRLGCWVRVV